MSNYLKAIIIFHSTCNNIYISYIFKNIMIIKASVFSNTYNTQFIYI